MLAAQTGLDWLFLLLLAVFLKTDDDLLFSGDRCLHRDANQRTVCVCGLS